MSPRARHIVATLLVLGVVLFAGRWTAGLFADRWWAEGISPAAVEFITSWRLLGLTMPAWVLLWALALGSVGVIANLRGSATAPRAGRTSGALAR